MQKYDTGIKSYSLRIQKPEIFITNKGANSVETTITWKKGK